MSEESYNLITILGHTAGGKTSVAARLASVIKSEVISADSRQVYKSMDLGTGKDYQDYIVDNISVPVHLIDIVPPGYKYNVFEYQKDFLKVFTDLRQENKVPVLCGGSGLYIEAVLKKYKLIQVPVNQSLRDSLKDKSLRELTEILGSLKTLHNRTDVDTIKRAIRAIEIEYYYKQNPEHSQNHPDINSLVIGINFDRELRRKRISERLKQRIEAGMIDEVRSLIAQGVCAEDLIYYGLEYKYLTEHIMGKLSFSEMFDKLEIAIHQFAKRQMTWFRGMEKRGIEINWISGELEPDKKINIILTLAHQKAVK